MAIADRKWSALPVPYAIETPDRARKERYFHPDFYAMEVELLWPRVWQMACRLEEIPQARDFVEYEFLDQSVVVVRTDAMEVRAYQNACRHRGVKVAEGHGTCADGFTCPFHGWCYGLDGQNTFVSQRKTFAEHNLAPDDINLIPVRCEVWGGCAWINLSDEAPPLRECIEPFATYADAWKMESMRAEKWYAARLPVNWKLAEAAFVEQYHVIETHPQLVIPGRYPPRGGGFDARTFVDAEIHYLHIMSDGMDGMVHANDVRIAEGLRSIELPDDPTVAIPMWHRAFNDAVVQWHRGEGCVIPDLNDLEARGMNEPMGYCFPHFFLLPMYSSASSYRFRPLGPEETLMEIWSLARFPAGSEVVRPTPPERWEANDPRWPPIPAQDFSNLPRQQKGLHTKGFEYLRLSERAEGHISNFERTLDGFLAGLSYEQLSAALQKVNVNPLERPIVEIDFLMSSYADVVEGIRATIAAYTHALDDGRTDDIVATFCADGVVEIPGMGTHEGHDALHAAYTKWKPRMPQRHLVVNTHVTDWNDHEASALSDVVFLLKGDAGWAIQVVGRYEDTLHNDDGTWRFHRRAASFVT